MVLFERLTRPLRGEVEADYFGVAEGFAKVDGDAKGIDEAKTS